MRAPSDEEPRQVDSRRFDAASLPNLNASYWRIERCDVAQFVGASQYNCSRTGTGITRNRHNRRDLHNLGNRMKRKLSVIGNDVHAPRHGTAIR